MSALAFLSILFPTCGVVLGGWRCIAVVAVVDFGLRRMTLFQQTFQKGAAPTAAGSGSVAVGQLAGQLGFFDADVLHDFALRDVKAEADFVVVIHDVTNAVATRHASR